MRMMSRRLMVLAALFTMHCALFVSPAGAQCGIENTAFQDGEVLNYNLYFNWRFVWVKVGSASMTTSLSKFGGQDAFRTSLTTRGNKTLDGVFTMRDTLLSFCRASDLTPLYHRKGALEGKRYYVDELWYTYPNKHCHLRMHRIDADGEVHWRDKEYTECIYDMMSIFLRARNFDASKMQKGDVIPMPISDARRLSNSWLKYRGKETFKVSDTKEKFRCLVFSFIEHEDNKNHELIRFYVTDDQNHIPVRLDLHLSFGSAKVFLRNYQGIRNEMTSKIN